MLKAGSGGAALDLLDRHARVDLVLLDFAMPGMSGAELARQIEQKSPALPILFVTGYADKTAFNDVDEERIIKKPFVDDELAAKVKTALIRGGPSLRNSVVPLRR